MPHKCVATECNSVQGKSCPFSRYQFPAEDPERREQWEVAVKRDGGWQSTEYSRLCGAHFVTGS